MVDCPNCAGTGKVTFRVATYTGHWGDVHFSQIKSCFDCSRCKGSGKLASPENCGSCDGKKEIVAAMLLGDIMDGSSLDLSDLPRMTLPCKCCAEPLHPVFKESTLKL